MAIQKKARVKSLKSHWDSAYEKAVVDQLGWYEAFPEPSLRLINECDFRKNARLLNVGAGATMLVDELLKLGYENIIVNDISAVALDKLKTRVGEKSSSIDWVLDDLTHSTKLAEIEPISLWHDRAVLHFFISEKDQKSYFNLLKKLVKPKGFVIIATFNFDGATMCSGLPVQRYDENMLQEKLGTDFKLKKAFDFTYRMPSGDAREYVYTLFQRK